MNATSAQPAPLSASGRFLVLAAAFLGWLCAGMHLSITSLAMQSAAVDLLGRTGELDPELFRELNRQAQYKQDLSAGDRDQLTRWQEMVARWFAWSQCAFLFGAAAGGLFFGWLGDRIGRSKGMAASILTYSALAGAAHFAQTPVQLLLLWFVTSMGVGGMWPNGVALVSEAWSSLSRPLAAGVIGTSANIGILIFSTIASRYPITSDEWRWVMLVAAAPLLLGLFSLVAVPESPRWLATRTVAAPLTRPANSATFERSFVPILLVGITLATIPMIGGWGSANWMIPWAGAAGESASPPDPFLKARVSQARALTGIAGSLLGGWIASVLGRRRSYCLVSLLALVVAQWTFWSVYPTDPAFLWWVAALGFLSGFYFGWMPLFLPELFPTRIRSTGAGVSFNFGRILTAVTIFIAGALMALFEGDYARIGRVTSLVFLAGVLVPWLAPDTSRKQLAD
jgi:MFS family permease